MIMIDGISIEIRVNKLNVKPRLFLMSRDLCYGFSVPGMIVIVNWFYKVEYYERGLKGDKK